MQSMHSTKALCSNFGEIDLTLIHYQWYLMEMKHKDGIWGNYDGCGGKDTESRGSEIGFLFGYLIKKIRKLQKLIQGHIDHFRFCIG